MINSIKVWQVRMNRDLEGGGFEGQFDGEVDELLEELGK